MNEKLQIVNHIPEGFLDIKPREITRLIDRPTLIHLKGEKDRPFFISILLHGNEFSGLIILQKILKKYSERVLPRSLIIFIANPKACEQGLRHLEDQQDFNRIWKGGSSYEGSLVKPILKYAKDQNIQGAIDIHNNTGESPVYTCINKIKEDTLKLAQIFSENIVYFTNPDSVLSIALSKFCPAIVLECGLPGERQGISSGVKLIESILDKEESWKKNKIKKDSLYHTYATILISQDTDLCFHSQPCVKDNCLCLLNQLDQFNFKLLKSGTFFGKINNSKQIKLVDKEGENIFDQFFSIVENDLIVKQPFIPCMLTKDTQIAKSDCLGYIMKKTPLDFHF